ncbi:MAG: hypothetical protein M3Z02_09125 [Actinomycetota bacterium]|nr:hypothetical protein [Actinomycetota bacterium]
MDRKGHDPLHLGATRLMSVLAWLVPIPLAALAAIAWTAWTSRTRRPAQTIDSVEEYQRFRAAFEQERRAGRQRGRSASGSGKPSG